MALFRLIWLLCFTHVSPSLAPQTFTQSDLEKCVAELEVFAPKNPRYLYPVECRLVTNPEANAYSTVMRTQQGLQTKIVVYTGLVKLLQGDPRLIRGVLAHEMSHLTLGHVSAPSSTSGDVALLLTREQEYEADRTGAALLERSGHSRQDFIDGLDKLAETDADAPWVLRILGDHASATSRIAALMKDPTVLNALVQYEIGLAYLESRRYDPAMTAFDVVSESRPELHGALTNASLAALYQYYDSLPEGVRAGWLVPDFGPSLGLPSIKSRGSRVTSADLTRYAEAKSRVEKSLSKSATARDRELMAVLEVLSPSDDVNSIKRGSETLRRMAEAEADPSVKLRLLNNYALGVDRTEGREAAFTGLAAAIRTTKSFNLRAAENLGLFQAAVTKEPRLMVDQLLGWLTHTSPFNEHYDAILNTYRSACQQANVAAQNPRTSYQLCQVVSLNTGAGEIAVMDSLKGLETKLGKPTTTSSLDKRYPDLGEVFWKSGNIAATLEGDRVIRLTSYQKGDALLLQALDPASHRAVKIEVGMSRATLEQNFDFKRIPVVTLNRAGLEEDWYYFDGLNFGLLLDDKEVTGLTVTPVEHTSPD